MNKRRTGGGLTAAILIVLAILYFSGKLDTTLYKVGLNLHRCGQNGYGAVFCGKALEEYEGRVSGAEQEVRGAAARVEDCARYGGASC